MCGLFGFVRQTKTEFYTREYLQNFTLAGTMRGAESVGYYFGASDMGQIEKFPVSGAAIAYSKVMPQLATLASNSTVLIGHHRASTHGEISTTNCHPFQRSANGRTIIGAHNGVIGGFNRTESDLKFSVDSDWVMYKLAELGDEAFKLFDGAFALAYVDVTAGNLVLTCNDLRPMCYAYVAKKNAMLYASEWGMLHCVASRNDIDLEDIYVMDKLERHTFNINNPRSVVKDKVSPPVSKTNIAPYMPRDNSGRFAGRGYKGYYNGLYDDSEWEGYYNNHKLTTKERSLVQKDEQDLAEGLGILGEVCTMYLDKPKQMTERVIAATGVASYDNDVERAIIRGIDKQSWWKLAKSKSFRAKIIGAKWAKGPGEVEKEFVVIVGEPLEVRLSDPEGTKKLFLLDNELDKLTKSKSSSN